MKLDPDICYQAMLARNRRFDGWFFVGVSTTGIYCRPVCPVRAPKRENCRFFPSRATAEQAGFRPCLRCRPELAPGNGLLDVSGRLARAAASLIDSGFLNGSTPAALARRIGVSGRHLRRIFAAEFGVSLGQFVRTQRLLMAKRLLTETRLPMAEVALAAGFGSQRRFNDLFRSRYGLSPRRFRQGGDGDTAAPLRFELAYRPPFSWSVLLAFLAQRRIDGVEAVAAGRYARTVTVEQDGQLRPGWMIVEHAPHRHSVTVTLPSALYRHVAHLLGRARHLFDLDCRPDLVDEQLGALAAEPLGVRVPGAFDGFEIAVRAIVGQQISVAQARTVLARIAGRFGSAVADPPMGLARTFPGAVALSQITPGSLCQLGITRIRAGAIIAVAQQVASRRLMLEPYVDLDEVLSVLRGIRGIGEWTVQYIAMRALAWPNAFPYGDAVLRKRLGLTDAAALGRHARQWEPWRAYATIRLWHGPGSDAASTGSLGTSES